MINPYEAQKASEIKDIIAFSQDVLGIPLHEGQIYWLKNSTKPVNLLKPANQWGKTTVEAIKHIWHAATKPQLSRFPMDFQDKFRFIYRTLNFGKTYEIAKGVMEAILDITESRYLLPNGSMNKSILTVGIRQIFDAPKLPRIDWTNNSQTLIRSYDGLGESFKRLRLAFISGDECGDIPELRLFLNGTLLPRLFFMQGSVDLVGTSQPKGIEYEEIAEEGESAMIRLGEKSDYFVISAKNNPDMATVYVNKFMPRERIEAIEAIADPELKKQIIYGQYVDYNKHLYTWEEINQMFQKDIPYDPQTGFSELPVAGAYYVFAVDMAAGDDETSLTCIRYRNKRVLRDDTFIALPHRIVFHKAWKGASIPLSLQYEMIKQYYKSYKNASGSRTSFVYDAGSLGGKNTGEAFRELHGYPFPPKGRSYGEIKGEGMGKVKEVLGRGREFVFDEKGVMVDKNPDWGGVKASADLKELRRQLEVSSMDDDKLKQDQYTSFMMALHFIEARAPRTIHQKAIDLNYNRGSLGRRA